MSIQPGPVRLAADFPAACRGEWRRAVAVARTPPGVRADVVPETALSATTYDGITIKPLYLAQDAGDAPAIGVPGRPPFTRGATRDGATVTGWDVRQRIVGRDAKQVSDAILTDLTNGTTSIWL